MEKARVGDIEVAYQTYGEGYPLVMATGLTATMDIWDPTFIEKLSSSYKVIVFDYRGMGETTSGSKEITIEQLTDDTVGFMDALGIDQAHLLGWSMGGDVVLGLACRYPDKVNKMVIYAGDCGGSQKVLTPRVREDFKKLADPSTPPGELLAILFPPEWMEANPDFLTRFPIPKETSSPENIQLQIDAYKGWAGVYDRLPQIEKPTLIATGTEDVSTPPENALILANQIPGSWLVRFEGAGHGLMYQYPEKFARIIIEFLE